MASEEQAIFLEHADKAFQQARLGLLVKIDHGVAAEDRIKRPLRPGWGQQVQCLEPKPFTQRGFDPDHARLASRTTMEMPAQVFRRYSGGLVHWINAPAGCRQRLCID